MIRAAEPWPCNRKRGQRAPGIKEQWLQQENPRLVLGPWGALGWDEQRPVCLCVQNPHWKARAFVPHRCPEVAAVVMLGPPLPPSCTPKCSAVCVPKDALPGSIQVLGFSFQLGAGDHRDLGNAGFLVPSPLSVPEQVCLSISQTTVGSFYIFPHSRAGLISSEFSFHAFLSLLF